MWLSLCAMFATTAPVIDRHGLLPGVRVSRNPPTLSFGRERNLCPAGRFTRWTKGVVPMRACNACPSGKYETHGTAQRYWNVCELCPRGQVQPRRGQTRCMPCWVLAPTLRARRDAQGAGGVTMDTGTAMALVTCDTIAHTQPSNRAKRRSGGGVVGQWAAIGPALSKLGQRPARETRAKDQAPSACAPGRYGAMRMVHRTHFHVGSARWMARFECVLCPPGQFQPQAGARVVSCLFCAPGRGTARMGGASSCTRCGWQQQLGNSSGATLVGCTKRVRYDCPAGRFLGQYDNNTSTSCRLCPLGKFKPHRAQLPPSLTSLLAVPAAQSSATTTLLHGCILCPVGKYTDDSVGGLNQTKDGVAEGAEDQDRAGARRARCSKCPIDLSADVLRSEVAYNRERVTAATLDAFSRRTFGLKRPPTSCLLCPIGSVTSGWQTEAQVATTYARDEKSQRSMAPPEANTAGQRCSACPAGREWELVPASVPYGATCRSCPRGRFRRVRPLVEAAALLSPRIVPRVPHDALSPCLMCPAGLHQAREGASQCVRCPSGKYVRFVAAPLFCYDCPARGCPDARSRAQVSASTSSVAPHTAHIAALIEDALIRAQITTTTTAAATELRVHDEVRRGTAHHAVPVRDALVHMLPATSISTTAAPATQAVTTAVAQVTGEGSWLGSALHMLDFFKSKATAAPNTETREPQQHFHRHNEPKQSDRQRQFHAIRAKQHTHVPMAKRHFHRYYRRKMEQEHNELNAALAALDVDTGRANLPVKGVQARAPSSFFTPQIKVRCAMGHYQRWAPAQAADHFTSANLVCTPCPPSRYQPEYTTRAHAGHCKQCPLGMYQPDIGAHACKLCLAGRIGVRKIGVSMCQACKPGFAAPSLGSTACVSLIDPWSLTRRTRYPTPVPTPEITLPPPTPVPPTPQPTTVPTPIPTPQPTPVPPTRQPTIAPALLNRAARALHMDTKRTALLLRTDTARETPKECAPGTWRPAEMALRERRGMRASMVFASPSAQLSMLWQGSRAHCQPCPPGKWGRSFACNKQEILLGLCDTDTPLKGASVCERCPAGKYQPHAGAIGCLACPTGQIPMRREHDVTVVTKAWTAAAQATRAADDTDDDESGRPAVADSSSLGAVQCWAPPALQKELEANHLLQQRLRRVERQASSAVALQSRVAELQGALRVAQQQLQQSWQQSAKRAAQPSVVEAKADAEAAQMINGYREALQKELDQARAQRTTWVRRDCAECLGHGRPCLTLSRAPVSTALKADKHHLSLHDRAQQLQMCVASAPDTGRCPVGTRRCTGSGLATNPPTPSPRLHMVSSSSSSDQQLVALQEKVLYLRQQKLEKSSKLSMKPNLGSFSPLPSPSVVTTPAPAPTPRAVSIWRKHHRPWAAGERCPARSWRWWCDRGATGPRSRAAVSDCLQGRLLLCLRCPPGQILQFPTGSPGVPSRRCRTCAAGEAWRVVAELRDASCVKLPHWHLSVSSVMPHAPLGSNPSAETQKSLCPDDAPHKWRCGRAALDGASQRAAQQCASGQLLFCMQCPDGYVWRADAGTDTSEDRGSWFLTHGGRCETCVHGTRWGVDAKRKAAVCLICSLGECDG